MTMDRKVILSLAIVGAFLMMPISVIDGTVIGDASDSSANGEIPSSFDMRNVYGSTPVRDQEPTALCESFAEAAALEYLVAKNGGELEWLSPYYLAYHRYDGFGREWSGDRNEVIFNEDVPFYGASGNSSNFTRLLSWISTVPDSVLPPYTSEEYGSYAFDDPELEKYMVHPTGVKFMSTDDQVDDVKRMIMSGYGGVLGVYVDEEQFCIVDGTIITYYSSTGSESNHAVTLVGWDDDYPKENFCQWPESDGAWLVKDSNGTEGRGDGYIWISYQSDIDEDVVFYDSIARESEDVLYDHCHGGAVRWVFTNDDCDVFYAANVFVATGDQMLTSIGLTSEADCVIDYSIQIYTSPSDPNDPASGIPALPEPQTGTIGFDGAQYVNLDTPIRLGEGETFSVVVKYEGDGMVSMLMNGYFDNSLITNYVVPITGVSFVFYGGEWVDTGVVYEMNVQIRAYAETIDDEAESMQFVPIMIIIVLVAITVAFTVRRD